MNTRQPRWMQVNNKMISSSKDRSIKSRSSRYTPRKSHDSEEDRSGIRAIVHNISQYSIDENNDRKLAKSAVIYTSSDQGGKGLSEVKGDSLSGSLQRKQAQLAKINKRMHIPELVKVDSGSDAQTQLKQYLFFIESVERKFLNQKLQIETMLITQHQQIKEVRNKIIDAYSQKESQFKDKQLKKLVQSRSGERLKQSQRKTLSRVVSDKNIDRTKMINRRQENSQISEEKRGKSTGSWASNKFDKIFNTLNQMKMNLNDCKKLRQSKSPRQQKTKQIEGKGNLVKTNLLKVKNKKTHE